MSTNDLHSARESANPYQPPTAGSAKTKGRVGYSRLGIASFAFAIVDVVAVVVLISGSRRTMDASIKGTMLASALGIVTGIASLFDRSRRRTFGIVGLAVAATIGLGLVAIATVIATLLDD
jgi:hypothetical protein